jgi:hypothetical protein
MKNKLILIGAGIVLVLLITLGVSFRIIHQQKLTLARLEHNQAVLLNKVDSMNTRITLSQKEFKSTISHQLDSVLDARGLKRSQIQEVTYVKNYYINHDTTIVKPVEVIQGRDTIFPFTDIKDCFTIGGYMRVIQNQPALTITTRKFDDETTIIGYWKRPHKFWFINWGKKENFVESSTKCGTVKVQQINIKQRK